MQKYVIDFYDNGTQEGKYTPIFLGVYFNEEWQCWVDERGNKRLHDAILSWEEVCSELGFDPKK